MYTKSFYEKSGRKIRNQNCFDKIDTTNHLIKVRVIKPRE